MTQCESVLHHGPGHQSKTRCQAAGEHSIHFAVYGCGQQYAEWKGAEATTGFFNEPPQEE